MNEFHRPVLSVTIPTYNRANYLAALFESMLRAGCLPPPATLEIVVSDNASSDETQSVVRRYTDRGLPIRSHRNQTNIGPDANILQCFNLARGTFVWVLGDDELLEPDALCSLVQVIQAAQARGVVYSMVYLSSRGFGPGETPQSAGTQDRFGRFAEEVTNRRYLMWKLNTLLGLISVIIVNKDLILSRPRPPLEDLNGSNLTQMGWVFPALQQPGVTLYIWRRLVHYRSFNTGGWSAARVFGTNMYAIAKRYFATESALVRAQQHGSLSTWLPDSVMTVRRGQSKDVEMKEYVAHLRADFHGDWRFWLCIYPVALLPMPLAAAYYRVSRGCARLFRVAEGVLRHLIWHGRYIEQPRLAATATGALAGHCRPAA